MRLIVGISGASGVILGYEMLKALKLLPDCEVHLVVTEGAVKNFECETDLTVQDVCALADVVHSNKNMAASISSGSFKTDGMIVIPCSMKTVAGIAAGYADNLLLRSADVCLKEGRKVVIVPREMPLSRLHLRNIKEASDYGCVVVPPMLTFYNGSNSVEKQMQHIIGKVLMQFGIVISILWPGKGRTKMQAKSFSLGAQEYLLEAVAVRCGDDLTVVIGGGEKQHIGAVAVGVPRPSLKDKNIVSSSASVLSLTGHKEDLLARKAALELARMLGHTVTVTVGLHIDNASAEAIAMLEANFQELLRQICLWAAA